MELMMMMMMTMLINLFFRHLFEKSVNFFLNNTVLLTSRSRYDLEKKKKEK